MQHKYCIIREDDILRLFYKGVELENIKSWEARHPDFHDITFTVASDSVDFHIDKETAIEQTTEEFLVERLLEKDEIIRQLQEELIRLRRSHGHEHGRANNG